MTRSRSFCSSRFALLDPLRPGGPSPVPNSGSVGSAPCIARPLGRWGRRPAGPTLPGFVLRAAFRRVATLRHASVFWVPVPRRGSQALGVLTLRVRSSPFHRLGHPVRVAHSGFAERPPREPLPRVLRAALPASGGSVRVSNSGSRIARVGGRRVPCAPFTVRAGPFGLPHLGFTDRPPQGPVPRALRAVLPGLGGSVGVSHPASWIASGRMPSVFGAALPRPGWVRWSFAFGVRGSPPRQPEPSVFGAALPRSGWGRWSFA